MLFRSRTVLLGTTGTTGPVLSIDGNYISEVVIREMTVDMSVNAANATGIMLKNGARRCLFEKVQVIGGDESHKLVSVGDSVTASHDVAFNSCELDGDGYVYVRGGSLSTEPTYSVSFNKCRLGIVDALNVAALVIQGGTINGAATISHTALIKLRTARGVTISDLYVDCQTDYLDTDSSVSGVVSVNNVFPTSYSGAYGLVSGSAVTRSSSYSNDRYNGFGSYDGAFLNKGLSESTTAAIFRKNLSSTHVAATEVSVAMTANSHSGYFLMDGSGNLSVTNGTNYLGVAASGKLMINTTTSAGGSTPATVLGYITIVNEAGTTIGKIPYFTA